MTHTQTVEPGTRERVVRSAVVWINGRAAIVVTKGDDGRVTTCQVSRSCLGEAEYLTQVVRVIGDCDRVVILGPGSVRLELERAYVAMFRRPDRLVDVEPVGLVTPDELVDRLRILAA